MKKIFAMSLVSAMTLAATGNASAAYVDRYEGGYPGGSGEGHDEVAYNFIKHFSYNQYYWAADFEFTYANNSYVDYMDIALFAGHGNQWWIQTGSTGVNLTTAGNSSHLGYGLWLDFIAFESCYVVPSPIERSDWWQYWVSSETNDVFDGLHQAIGFRTVSWQSTDQNVSNMFGQRVHENYAVWQSWFDARNYHGRSDEMASAVMNPNCQNDTYGSTCTNPSSTDMSLTVWYQY